MTKPRGKTGPIRIGLDGITRQLVDFPAAKEDIELMMARLFCAANAGMRPQIARYGGFANLEQQAQNASDFTVVTAQGKKWLELTEFAPLNRFGHSYENVPASWDASTMRKTLRALIDKKAAKGYGPGVILVIYKTHQTLLVPPPVLRALRADLASAEISFEAIYFLSPHDQESASVWEVYPGDPADDGPALRSGTVHLGFGQ